MPCNITFTINITFPFHPILPMCFLSFWATGRLVELQPVKHVHSEIAMKHGPTSSATALWTYLALSTGFWTQAVSGFPTLHPSKGPARF